MRDVYSGPGFAVTLDETDGTPVKLLARAEVHLLEGPLAGLAVRGFSLWRGGQGGVLVTPPRLSSKQPFLRPSRLAQAGASERALRAVFDGILKAHAMRSKSGRPRAQDGA